MSIIRSQKKSIIYYSVLFSLLSMLKHTEISERKYCCCWEFKGYILASTTLWLMFSACCMISDVWTVCKHSEGVTHVKPYCGSGLKTSLQINGSHEEWSDKYVPQIIIIWMSISIPPKQLILLNDYWTTVDSVLWWILFCIFVFCLV